MVAKVPYFPLPLLTPRLLIRPPKMGDEIALNYAIRESYETLKATMAWAKTCPFIVPPIN
jgi:ribosomal-protein-serine acetyltransferase